MFARGLLMTAVMASALLPLAACSTDKDKDVDTVQVSDGTLTDTITAKSSPRLGRDL